MKLLLSTFSKKLENAPHLKFVISLIVSDLPIHTLYIVIISFTDPIVQTVLRVLAAVPTMPV